MFHVQRARVVLSISARVFRVFFFLRGGGGQVGSGWGAAPPLPPVRYARSTHAAARHEVGERCLAGPDQVMAAVAVPVVHLDLDGAVHVAVAERRDRDREPAPGRIQRLHHRLGLVEQLKPGIGHTIGSQALSATPSMCTT